MAQIETWFDQDLKKPVPVRKLDVIFNEDSQGNKIGVRLFDDGVALDSISGSVTGYFLLADGTTTSISGSKSGNMASVIVPPSAYKVPGPITITIRITDDGNITTVCACVGLVMLSKTPVATPPGSTVADWSAQISAQLQACQDAADNVGAIVASAYSVSATYDVGTYVTYNGNFYRCITAVSTAGEWSSNSGNFIQTKVSSELLDIKGAFLKLTDSTELTNWTDGYIYYIGAGIDGIDAENGLTAQDHYHCTYVSCNPGDVFVVTGKGASRARCWAFLSAISGDDNIISQATYEDSSAGLDNVRVVAPYNAQYAIFNANTHNFSRVIKQPHPEANVINKSTDLNSLTTDGTYKVWHGNTSVDNLPEEIGNTADVIIRVNAFSNGKVYQECFDIDNGVYYSRYKSSTWSNWVSNQDNKTASSKIAEGYYKVQYIESDGNSYIDTGISFKPTTGFEMVFMNKSNLAGSGYGNLIGSRISSLSSDFELTTYCNSSSSSGFIRGGSSGIKAYLKKDIKQSVSWLNGIYTIDGNSYELANTTTSDNELNITVFGLNSNNTSITQKAKMRLYELKMYEGETLVRNMIPCVTIEGYAGLYDLIEEKFYGNNGKGRISCYGISDDYYLDRMSNDESGYLDYAFEQEAQDTAEKIKNACTEGALVVGFVTDSHYGLSGNHSGVTFATIWDNTIKTIHRVNQLSCFDLFVHGGDIAAGDIQKTSTCIVLQKMKRDMKSALESPHLLTGNHDDNITYYNKQNPKAGFITRAERYSLYAYQEDCDEILTGYSAGYKDFPQFGIRVIFLDAVLDDNVYTEQDHTSWIGFTQEQVAWVRDVALNTSYQVMFFSHCCCSTDFNYGESTPVKVRGGDYAITTGDVLLRDVIETFISNGGVVIGFFHGHTHWDNIAKYSNSNGFYEVSTGRAVYDTNTQANYTKYMPKNAYIETKTLGTASQELWDAIVIKPVIRQVSMIRYGAGSDRTFTY